MGLAALRASTAESAKDLDFMGVFLERQELIDTFPQIIEADKALIRSFGLEPLPIEPGKALRISILPLSAASFKGNPHRIITPVLHYVNADPTSGKYPQGDSVASLEWEIRYLCLRKLEVSRIRRLPDEGQTPSDIDLIMAPDTVNGFGYHLSRISTQARWCLDPEIANEIQRQVSKIDAEFDTKFFGMPDVQIFNDFRAANESFQK